MSLLRKFTTVSLAFAVVFASVSIVVPVSAADPVESITLSPTAKLYKVDPGQTLSDTLTILNDGQTAYDFTVYASPYSVTGNSYDSPSFSKNAPNADAYTWMQFEKTTYHAEPRQTLTIPYTIYVKPNASPGGHYGAIFAEVQPAPGQGQLARKKRVGCVIYATVNGDVHTVGNVNSITVPWFQSTTPMTASTLVQNTGNNHFPATVAYQVSDIFGRTTYSTQSDYEILPGTTRQIDMSWTGAAWFGFYKVHASAMVLGKTMTRDSYVLMIPVWLVLLLTLAVVFGGVYALTRKSHRKTTDA